MKRNQIIIRDPFVLNDNGTYYLYGTRSETAWKQAEGFDVYISLDLEEWTGPIEIFHKPEDFWADQNYWAPECIKIGRKYYLAATFGSINRKKGIQILVSGQAEGPFSLLTDKPITPEEWTCLDGSIYKDPEDESLWLVFSHSFPEAMKGAICAARLSEDLKKITTKPVILFHAADAAWTRPIPFAKEEFGIDDEAYFSDGPYLFKNEKGELSILWSSWSEKGYAMGVSVSTTGKINGPWKHQNSPFKIDGGHGMIFKNNKGQMYLTYHSPNESLKEHPVFEAI